MKNKFGLIVTDGYGKLGGQVFTKNRFGNMIKTKVTPINHQTARQSFVRNNHRTVALAWSSLSESERREWIKESENYPIKDGFGDVHYLSGFGLFTKFNMVRLNLGESLLNIPPVLFSFPIWELIDIKVFSLNPSIWLFVTPSIPAGFKIVVSASKVLSAGQSYSYGKFKFISYLNDGQTFPVNILEDWQSIFSDSFIPGKCIFFKISLVNLSSGRVSQSAVKKVVIEEGYSLGFLPAFSSLGQQAGETYIKSMATDGTTVILAGTQTNGKILRSVNDGVSFSDLGQQFSQIAIQSLCYCGNNLFIATTNNGGFILRSTNGGLNWSNLGNMFSLLNIVCSYNAGNGLIFAGGGPLGYILRSIDYGLNWSSSGNLFSQANIEAFTRTSDGTMLASTSPNGLILRSLDNGLTWVNLGAMFSQTYCYSLCSLDNGIVLCSTFPNAYILRSVDNGLTWVNLGQQFAQTIINTFLYLGSGVVIAGTGNSAYLLISYDFGLTWSNLGTQFAQFRILSSILYQGNKIFLGTRNSGLVLTSTF